MIEDLSRLKSNLANGKIREVDFPTYQVINALIDQIMKLQKALDTRITIIADDGNGVKDLDYITHTNESSNLPNSRQLIAGTEVAFDVTVPGQLIINVSAIPPASEWDVLTDGDVLETELIFASGEVIMVET